MNRRAARVESITALDSTPAQPPVPVIGLPPPVKRWDLVHAPTSRLIARLWAPSIDGLPAGDLWTLELADDVRRLLPGTGPYEIEGDEVTAVLAARVIAAFVGVL